LMHASVTNKGLAAVAPRLKTLVLVGQEGIEVHDPAVFALMTQLETFEIHGSDEIGDACLIAVAPHLKKLVVGRNYTLTNAIFGHMERLQELHFGENDRITDDALVAVARVQDSMTRRFGGFSHRLHTLGLGRARITNAGLGAVAPYLTTLHLRVNREGVSDDVFSRMSQLRELHVDYNETITDAALFAVAPRLTTLSLGDHNSFTLAPFAAMHQLTTLTMASYAGDAYRRLMGRRRFDNSPTYNTTLDDRVLLALPQLTSLDLHGNMDITDNGFKNLVHLKTLALNCNVEITDAALEFTPMLTSLDLGYNRNITANGLERLDNLRHLKWFVYAALARPNVMSESILRRLSPANRDDIIKVQTDTTSGNFKWTDD
jgi:hypothetical protein